MPALISAALKGIIRTLPLVQYLEASDVDAGPQGLLQQRSHNVEAFLTALDEQLPDLPADCRFSTADLEAEGSAERPQVANCLLHIQSAYGGPHIPPVLEQIPHTPPSAPRSSCTTNSRQQSLATPPPQLGFDPAQTSYMTPNAVLLGPQQHGHISSYGGYVSSSHGMLHHRNSPGSHHSPMRVLASPLMDGQANLHSGGHHYLQAGHQSNAGGALGNNAAGSLVPLRSSTQYGSSINAATHKSVQAAAGVTKLMQQCTNMLKERMGFPMEPGSAGGRYTGSPGPDSAMKALGPVLEGVLGHLTEEYEKRLLAKDHDLSRMNDVKTKAEREVARLQVRCISGICHETTATHVPGVGLSLLLSIHICCSLTVSVG